MALEISRTLLAAIRAEAASSPAAEVCGLLFGSRARITAAQSCPNVAAEPAHRFEIDPAALLAAHRRARTGGPAIAGCYHSHPGGDACPSVTDAAQAAADGWIWLIVADEARAWRAVERGQVHGRFDHVALRPTD